MSATIDHLRVDHRVTVLRDFTDAAGITLRAGESGVICGLSFDQIRREIYIQIERASGKVTLTFSANAKTGPGNGHMREYFEMGEDVTMPRVLPIHRSPSERTMIVPPPSRDESSSSSGPDWWRKALALEAAGKDTEAEQAIRQAVPHVGAASSIAEMYARRMRMFQRAGDEPRAIAAFKKAVDWMGTYAGWATSGGEGAALSYERDQFHAALVKEFGYDPTEK